MALFSFIIFIMRLERHSLLEPNFLEATLAWNDARWGSSITPCSSLIYY